MHDDDECWIGQSRLCNDRPFEEGIGGDAVGDSVRLEIKQFKAIDSTQNPPADEVHYT